MKRLWEWIKRPHGAALVVLYIFTVGCIAGSIVFGVMGADVSYGFVAYIFYALAAILLGYTVYTIVIYAPTAKQKITQKLKSNKFAANILDDYDFKTTVLAILSFGITVAFATMNLVLSIRYRLIWYGAIAAYYFVLILFRGGVLTAYNKCAKKFANEPQRYEKCKWRIYLASGAFLIAVEFAMVAAVTQMMLSERPIKSGEITAISNAAYTFYKIIMAVYNLTKARKSSNPVTQSLRNLNFADACMSVVSLTVLMISTFDGGTAAMSMKYVRSTVGFAACAAIIALATVMIIRANKKLTSFNGEDKNEQQ